MALRRNSIVSKDSKKYINFSQDYILDFLNSFANSKQSNFSFFNQTQSKGYYWFSLVRSPKTVCNLLTSDQKLDISNFYQKQCVENFFVKYPEFRADLNKYKIHLAVKTEFISKCLLKLRRDVLEKKNEYKKCMSIFKVIKDNARFEKCTSETQRSMATIVFYPHCKEGAAQKLLDLLLELFKNKLQKYARGDFLDHNVPVNKYSDQKTCLFWAGGDGDLKPGGVLMHFMSPQTGQDYDYLNNFVNEVFQETFPNQYPKVKGQKDLKFNI